MDSTILTIMVAFGGGLVASVVTSVLAPRLNSYFEFRRGRRQILSKALFELLKLRANCEFHLLDNYFGAIEENLKAYAQRKGISAHDFDRGFKILRERHFELPKGMPGEAEKHFADTINDVAISLMPGDPSLAFYIQERHGRILVSPTVVKKGDLPDDVQTRINENRLKRLNLDVRLVAFTISTWTLLKVEVSRFNAKTELNTVRNAIIRRRVDEELGDPIVFLLNHVDIFEQLHTEQKLPPRKSVNDQNKLADPSRAD